jgi:bifunctional DNA-binding transcriptional regulator/antitoxin component of YhaV-PrlF toxin-antitoxin module
MGTYNINLSMKGQLTVASEVRKILGLLPGGKVQLRVTDDGTVTMLAKKRGIDHLLGLSAKPDKPIDLEAEIMSEVWDRNSPTHPRERP